MNILGLNFFRPNASAALFVDGRLVAAAEEERFNRTKFSAGLPLDAVDFCLRRAGLRFREIQVLTYARSTNTRLVNTDQFHFQERIFKADSLYDRYRLDMKLVNFRERLGRHFEVAPESLVFRLQEQDHHLSHMHSGFHGSPFEEALLVSCDGFGDFVSFKLGVGRGAGIEVLHETPFPHSLGLFYTMVTQYLGFTRYGDEAKVMGLSTFGHPEYTDRLRRLISNDNGGFRLNLQYFNQQNGVETRWSEVGPDIGSLYNAGLEPLIGPPRQPDEPVDERVRNIASSLQHLTEEIVVAILDRAVAEHGIRDLVLTGGLAYNSLLNSRILEETEIERLYVPPAPGNGGLSVGSVLAYLGDEAPREEMLHAFWGSEYSDEQVEALLGDRGLAFERPANPLEAAVELLEKGAGLAWFQGRMEFGPRSLGSRCILISPRASHPERVKRRDYLKPLGVSILEEHAGECIHNPHRSPFMSFMGRIRARRREDFENVLLNDFCRYQTVGSENPRLRELLLAFREKTGLPFLINTSLNPEGEPILESPAQLVDCLDRLQVEAVLIGNHLVRALSWVGERGHTKNTNVSTEGTT